MGTTPKRVQSVQSGQQRTDAAQGVVPGSIPGCWLIGGRDGAGAGVAKFARAFGGDGSAQVLRRLLPARPGSIPGAANSRFGGIVQAGRVLLHPAPVGERPEHFGLAATLGRLGW